MRKNFWLVVGVVVWWGLGAVSGVGAQGETAVFPITQNQARLDFPETVTFAVMVAEDVPIVSAVLTYDVSRVSCLEAAAQVPVEVVNNRAEWTWVMSRSGNPPPGATLWWEWTLTDANGRSYTTPRQTLTFTDDRFDWRTVENERIRLHWYKGETVGPMLLESAVAGLKRLEDEMGIQLQGQVQFFIYGSSAEMREAVLYIQDWAGGVAFSDYNIILMGVPPEIAESWGRPTVRHELAHLVVEQFGRSCVGGHRPTWLNEGLAVYAEGPPDESILSAIEQAREQNSFEPLRSLNGAFPAHSGAANVAYAQSYSVVAFMLETYGPEKMQAFLLKLAEGESYDEALEAVYGLNVDGLELAWREAIGAPPRDIPPTPTPISPDLIPTVPPLPGPQSVPTPEVIADVPTVPPPSSGRPVVCGLGFIPWVLFGVLMVRPGRGRKRE